MGILKETHGDTQLSYILLSAFAEHQTGCLVASLLCIAWDKNSSLLFWWFLYWSVKSARDLLLCNHFTENIIKINQNLHKT